MARKRPRGPESPKIRKLKSFDESRFWRRLTGFDTAPVFQGDKDEVARLRANVGEVVKHLKSILDWITSTCRSTPCTTRPISSTSLA